jgi:hypothetical protein
MKKSSRLGECATLPLGVEDQIHHLKFVVYELRSGAPGRQLRWPLIMPPGEFAAWAFGQCRKQIHQLAVANVDLKIANLRHKPWR